MTEIGERLHIVYRKTYKERNKKNEKKARCVREERYLFGSDRVDVGNYDRGIEHFTWICLIARHWTWAVH